MKINMICIKLHKNTKKLKIWNFAIGVTRAVTIRELESFPCAILVPGTTLLTRDSTNSNYRVTNYML